jgi:hypothetical protein
MPRGKDCAAHTHDAVVPQEDHHVVPLSRGGPDRKSNLLRVCANAHSDVHYLLSAIEKARGYDGVPEAVKRSFGYGVRRIALQGWRAYEADFLAGKLWREIELWESSGRAYLTTVPDFATAAAMADGAAGARPLGIAEAYTEWWRERRLLQEQGQR